MFTVNTNVIQTLLDKAVRGCGSGTAGKINRPIDKMGLFEVNDGVLQVTTTNSSHFLKVRASGISGDNCSFVCADIYAVNALISKITTETVSFDVQGTTFTVKGNGDYIMMVATDEEEGEAIEFPQPAQVTSDNTIQTMDICIENIMSIIDSNSLFLAEDYSKSKALVDYYFDTEKAVSGDAIAVCFNETKTFGIETTCSREFLNLMKLFPRTDDDGNMYKVGAEIYNDNDGTYIHIGSHNIDIYGYIHGRNGDEYDYPVDLLSVYLDTNFPKKCYLSAAEILSCLDRVNLFANKLDDTKLDPPVYMVFENNGIIFSNKNHTCSEKIKYVMNETSEGDYSTPLSIKYLRKALKSVPEDTFMLSYGNNQCIKISAGKNVQIIIAEQDD